MEDVVRRKQGYGTWNTEMTYKIELKEEHNVKLILEENQATVTVIRVVEIPLLSCLTMYGCQARRYVLHWTRFFTRTTFKIHDFFGININVVSTLPWCNISTIWTRYLLLNAKWSTAVGTPYVCTQATHFEYIHMSVTPDITAPRGVFEVPPRTRCDL